MSTQEFILEMFKIVGTIVGAYIAIVPSLKQDIKSSKSGINTEELANAFKEISEIKEQSKLNTAALKYLLKYNLEEMYFKFKVKQFKLTQIDIEQWNNEFNVYSQCGGNGTVAEFNAEIQTRIRENMRSE